MNEYAARVAPLLVAAFPEEAKGIVVDDEGDLSLEIACPSGSVDAGLSIRTWNEDVVVGFHTHHDHYSDWYGTGTDEHIDAAIKAARNVVAERLVVVSRYCRGKSLGSYWDGPEYALTEFRATTAKGSKGWLERRRVEHRVNLSGRLRSHVYGVELTLRSWNGTYDSDSTERD